MRLSRQRVLALLVLTSILLITLDSRGSTAINKAKSSFVELISPLQGVGRAIASPIRNTWRGITQYDDVQRENDRLRALNESLTGDAVAGQAALRNWLELAAEASIESAGKYSNVIAKVFAGSPSNVRQTVEIDKGSDQGIRVGMPVINGAGLVGKITQVSAHRAVVLLITDPTYSVPVTVSGPLSLPGTDAAVADGQVPPGVTTTSTAVSVPGSVPSTDATATGIETLPVDVAAGTVGSDGQPISNGSVPDSSVSDGSVPDASAPTTTVVPTSTTVFDLSKLRPRETGGLEGRGAGKLPIVRFVAGDAKGLQIKVGDIVVTNGGSTDLATDLRSLAPADLVIGRVSNVIERPGQAGPEIEVEPEADLTRLNFLRVILYIPPSETGGG